MPISLTAFDDGVLCHGYLWTVTDEGKLARILAHLVLGDHVHAANIVARMTSRPLKTEDQLLESAATWIRTPPANQQLVYHRDGLIFQMISWIAAQKVLRAGSLVRAPHIVMAHKGFDGLIIERDDQAGGHVVICEDKATERPRTTIRTEVWPEFASIESNSKHRELQSEVSTLTLQLNDSNERKKLIERIFWKEKKHYRVAVTIEVDHASPSGRQRLFRGYDLHVAGDPPRRRRAEALIQSNIRSWLDGICMLTADALDAMRS
jgi:hypothetical protein